MAVSKYKTAYNRLGEERTQEVPRGLSQTVVVRIVNRRRVETSDADQFWEVRKDENWTVVPGFRRFNRKLRQVKFTARIGDILVNLEPGTSFNPTKVWEIELERERQEKLEAEKSDAVAAASSSSNGKGKKPKEEVLKKEDIIRLNTAAESKKQKIAEETLLIRNSKGDSNPTKALLAKIRKVTVPQSRGILYIEILNQAFLAYEKDGDKRLLYETLWAIDRIELPETKCPSIPDKGLLVRPDRAVLIYDHFDANDKKHCAVEKLLKKARKVLRSESDLIKLQLVEMSDSLPPLSQFTFGYKLDVWQKRVLKWIDAGKSVVICAPTSSGKTVLSSYVAKASAETSALEHRKGGKNHRGGAGAGAGPVALAATAEDGEDDDEEEEEGDWEENAGGDDEEGACAAPVAECGDDDDDDEDDSDEEGAATETKHLAAKQRAAAAASADPSAALNPDTLGSSPLVDRLVAEDRDKRLKFIEQKLGVTEGVQRVLFVVPTEPLVWQVAAYFTKLLREGNSSEAKIAIVTDQLVYYPPKKFDVMPQIVVGTPLALEDALTKSRGLVGKEECSGKAMGTSLPGGFDHFDWAIYDEVHALDGEAGAALQRLIRAMSCKFLALSATVGNAEELRGWMEKVKGEQAGALGIEAINVDASEVSHATAVKPPKPPDTAAAAAGAECDIVISNTPTDITLIRTVSAKSITIQVIPATCTVLDLKKRICDDLWPDLDPPPHQEHTRYQIQLMFGGKEMNDDTQLVYSYDVFSSPAPQIYIRSLVHALNHQGRFINLQRYQWDQNRTGDPLNTINPLAAVESVEALQNGVLSNSSLSFTSRDSFKLWEKIKAIYPAEAAAPMDPYSFFGAEERLTLQRTKDYEDLLKVGLAKLATDFPQETQELLYAFRISDPAKEFDIYDVVMELKKKEMLPCLPFHLNTFEAIKLFQQLLLGLEWRQKRDHPLHYTQLKEKKAAANKNKTKQEKDTGKNEKELEEKKKAGEIESVSDSGTIDENEPHPDYTFCNGMPITDIEMTNLAEEMELFDGFEKRSSEAMKLLRGKNQTILSHALMRGLRRGIGLFINEVSFPSYRRAVQRLASKGKLNVVISDDSLAFGVNMPFRTCVFCGEMFGGLDELMAQQMSGRAGRRGLDTKGNLVYAGQRASHVRRIMIGTISNITGALHEPKYESMILQPILSPRHVGWCRSEVMGRDTLQQYIAKHHAQATPEEQDRFLNTNFVDVSSDKPVSYTTSVSRQAMIDMNFIVERDGQLVPNDEFGVTYSLLSLIWMMRHHIHESITVGLLFPQLIEQFSAMLFHISFREKKDNADKVMLAQHRLYAAFVVMIDREPYVEGTSIDRLEDLPYFTHYPDNLQFLQEWEGMFAEAQSQIPDIWAHMRDPVVPGTPLDGTFMRCIMERPYIHTLPEPVKQRMKEKFWRAGNTLKAMNNCCWPEPEYHRVAFFLFRGGFASLRYLNSEMIRAVTNFDDISAADREHRAEGSGTAEVTERLNKRPYDLWFDNHNVEKEKLFQNSWSTAMLRLRDRCSALRGESTSQHAAYIKNIDSFGLLQYTDKPLLVQLIDHDLTQDIAAVFSEANMEKLAQAIAGCSFVRNSPSRLIQELSAIGVAAWYCDAVLHPVANSKWNARFPMILKSMFEEEVLSKNAVLLWDSLPYEVQWLFTPVSDQGFSEHNVRGAVKAVSDAILGAAAAPVDGAAPVDVPGPSAGITAAALAAAQDVNAVLSSGEEGTLYASSILSRETMQTLSAAGKMLVTWIAAQGDDDDEDDSEEEESDEDEE